MIRLFAHRGFAKNPSEENSITSLNQAYEAGFRVVEFDIWFLKGKLVLKHNKPEANEIDNLPNLRDYFRFKNEIKYWIDFKNLDKNNAAKALEIVKQDIAHGNIDLDNIYFAPFIINHQKAEVVFEEIRKVFGQEAQLVAVCEELNSPQDIENLYRFLTKNNIKYLSIFYKLIDHNLLQALNGIELFAWTVNDEDVLHNLKTIGVKNFATDKIIPK